MPVVTVFYALGKCTEQYFTGSIRCAANRWVLTQVQDMQLLGEYTCCYRLNFLSTTFV